MVIKMKRLITIIICILLLVMSFLYLDKISNKLANLFRSTPRVSNIEKNQYAREKDYKYVQITNDFTPYNYQELLNVFYTILDSGYDRFTFYCPDEYSDCLKDVESISKKENRETLTTVSNFVHPYNNFASIRVKYDTAGEVTVEISHLYTKEEIIKVSNKVDQIWKEIITDDMDNLDIIYAFHDYIINHTKYDEEFDEKADDNLHDSSRAFGPLFEGYAICSGYTDVMSILLDKLGIDNYKVASDTHVWNAFYLDGKWWHIDLTWDDPVTKDGSNRLEHTFFKIDTDTLENFKIDNHAFNKAVYRELK